jgi:hypothetical protein
MHEPPSRPACRRRRNGIINLEALRRSIAVDKKAMRRAPPAQESASLIAHLSNCPIADLAQDEENSALEFLQQDGNGNFVYNFALARVRLTGKTAGAKATSVRVFFRLFQAQTANSSFNEATTYRLGSDGVLNGHKIPLLGIQNDGSGNQNTRQFLALPRRG